MSNPRRGFLLFVLFGLSSFLNHPRAVAQPWTPSPTVAIAAATADEQQTSTPSPSSLIQRLEGREDELMLWIGIAITFFVVGWVCGGNFYLRRDRNRRRKLRF
jgi:hypothetical protein